MTTRRWKISLRELKYFSTWRNFRISRRPLNFHVVISKISAIHTHTNNDGFDDVPKISDHTLKIAMILQTLLEGHTNVFEHFPEIFGDHQRLLKTYKDDLSMYRSYTNN